MLLNKQMPHDFKVRFFQDGYYVLKNVLEPEQVLRVKRIVSQLQEHELAAGAAHLYDDSGLLQRVWNLLNKHPLFLELIQNPLILQAMEIIFDRPTIHQKFYLSSFQSNTLRPGAPEQKVHIDTPFPEPLPSWPVKANSIWLLDDFTENNGATEVVPGSHKRNFKPKPDETNELIKIIAPAGSVLISHGQIWHRSGSNNSSGSRTVLLGSFAASYAREIAAEEDQIKVLNPEIRRTASDTLKKILAPEHGIKPGSLIVPSEHILNL